jgi:uncharacterized protein (TIGR02246 family)
MMRKSRIAAVLAVLAVAACSDGSDPAGPEGAVRAVAGESYVFDGVGAGHGQMKAIENLVAAQEAAWAAKDGVAYGATYAVNAEVVSPVGGLLVGRSGIAAQHVFLFNPANGPFRESTSTWQIRRVTFLTGSMAHVGLDVELKGYSSLPPGLPAVEPGIVRTKWSWIAVKRGSTWEIFHQHMTPVPPLAPPMS